MIPDKKKKKKMEVATDEEEDQEDVDGEDVHSTEKVQEEEEEEERAELERVLVCRKCGDAGFEELLVFCEKCQVSAEHCYCLDEFPNVDADFIWSCEECVPKVISSLNKVTLHPTRKSERITRKRKKRLDKKGTTTEVELQQCDVPINQQPSELRTKDTPLAPELQQCDVAFTQQPSELRTKDTPLAPELQQCDVAFTQQPSELRTKDAPVAPELQQCDVAFTQQPSELRTKDTPLAPELQQCDVAFTQQPSELRTKDAPVAPELQQCDVAFTQQPSELQTKDVPLASVPFIIDSSLQSEESRSSHICADTNEDLELKRKRRRLVLEDGEISDEDTKYEQVEQTQIYPDVGDDPNNMLPVEYNIGDAPKSILPVDSDVGDVVKSILEVNSNTGNAPTSMLPVDSDVGDAAKSRLEVYSYTGDAPKTMPQVNTDVCNASKSPVLSYASEGVHTRPVIDPVWRGCFHISNEKYGRAVAHLTNKACLKVWEGANALSPLICAEMLSRLDAWPNSFTKAAPTDDNIALYFFPESERDFENFDELVNEMIDLDLALKVFLDKAELFIYPSYQLPQQYWRFCGRYYLWGVFRGRKVPAPAKPAEPLFICDKGAECMDETRNSSSRTRRRTSPLSPLSTASSYG